MTIQFGHKAIAKIITIENKEFYIRENMREITLGREKNDIPDYFQIGETNTISKKHARIFWDDSSRTWKIQNLSKNKIYVNVEQLLQSD